ncbi:hypothetical protein CDAR_388501 [Caerostris darwini]|uniref:Uncharacterized protein n=1 Tax=Caerostris darwini TaxID=1538125 RepID=A0AAV4QYL3_9ARAC|nr:hypothetical protein CDAR_388501 [Caerostris darwini]
MLGGARYHDEGDSETVLSRRFTGPTTDHHNIPLSKESNPVRLPRTYNFIRPRNLNSSSNSSMTPFHPRLSHSSQSTTKLEVCPQFTSFGKILFIIVAVSSLKFY